ncbi:MAG: hypothetical protein IH861_11485 [Chloroflexi bacterium]|nr:hypothetical protein [Chloroflexota bacterium]
MINARRGVAVFLSLLLLLTFGGALTALQVSGTFLSPSYYVDVMRRANFYEFLLTEVATAAIDDVRRADPGPNADSTSVHPLDALEISTEEIVAAINTAFPEEWVQENAETIIQEVGAYVAGEQDGFQITVQAGDQVGTLVLEFSEIVLRSKTYDFVFDQMLTPAISGAIDGELPLGLEVSGDQVISSVRRVLPEEWVNPQIESAVREVTPYLIGREDSFEIIVPLDGRMALALQEVKVLLRDADAYEKLYKSLVEPLVTKGVGDAVALPYGVSFTRDEIAAAMREVAPPTWVQEQAEQIIDDSTPYLTGQSDTFFTEINLVDNKRRALVVVEATAILKLEELIDALPKCSATQTLEELIAGGLSGTLDCVPALTPTRQIADFFGGEVARAIEPNIINAIPDTIKFTEADLLETLRIAGSSDDVNMIHNVRASVGRGWRYTETDLQEDIQQYVTGPGDGEGGEGSFERFRSSLADGWTYSDADLRESESLQLSPDEFGQFERMRNILRQVKRYRYLILLPILITLVEIGFLGGRSWSIRFAWASGALLVVSVLTLLIVSLMFGVFFEPFLQQLREGMLAGLLGGGDFPATRQLIANKLTEIIDIVSEDLVSGIMGKSFIFIAIGIAGLAISLGWEYIIAFANSANVRRLRDRLPLGR